MKVLLINKFLYPRGGDAICAINTGRLLQSRGHHVIFWGMKHPFNPRYPYEDLFVDYVDYNEPGRIGRDIRMAFKIFYSFEAKAKVEKVITQERPDIIHLHNFAHQISPSILHVFKKYKIPVVMTMHDYKITCPAYSMILKGTICECKACQKHRFYECFLRSCVKDSRLKSAVATCEMYLHHKILHIYDLINIYISPSIFLKKQTEDMGFNKQVEYLPNFIDVGESSPRFDWVEKSIVTFGRLSKEKGLFSLIEAVKGLDCMLKIIGEGPLKDSLCERVKALGLNNVEFLGYKSGDELKNEIEKSMFSVFTSEWYENNPRSILESFALGKPVIGARIGGIPELIKDNETGLTFEAANVEDLRSKIRALILNPEKIVVMGKNARAFVENDFGAEKHYDKLMDIYRRAKNGRNKGKN